MEHVFDYTEDIVCNYVREALESIDTNEDYAETEELVTEGGKSHGKPRQELSELDKELSQNKIGFVLETRAQITRFFQENAHLSSKIILLLIIFTLLYPGVIVKSNIDCNHMVSTAQNINETASYVMTTERRNLYLAKFYSECLYLAAITDIYTTDYAITYYKQLISAEEVYFANYGYADRTTYFNTKIIELNSSYTSSRQQNNVLFTTDTNGRLSKHKKLLFKDEVQLILPGSNFTGNEQHMGLISALDQVIIYIYIYIMYRLLYQCIH